MRTVISGYPKEHMKETMEGILMSYPHIDKIEIEETPKSACVVIILSKEKENGH